METLSKPEVQNQRQKFQLHSDPDFRDYQIRQFTSSEYWKYIMRFGKRKMTKDEWEIWNGKKQREEKMKNDYYFEIKYGIRR